MNFEDWYESRVGISVETAILMEVSDLQIIQEAWNAAIKEAMWYASMAVAMEGETLEIQVQDAVRKLLTAS